ncbi:maltokinase [Streptomyces sp. E11-3]|uniref:maltokinase N-terminal cap-like domain-containing protein n=1 Tax=Streptomyces sp. E11-3 TaxID=3110112 RepID=UPI0039807D61
MSEAATRLGTTAVALLSSLDPLLRDWLPRQRWFAGKGRPVTGFGLVSAAELLPPSAAAPSAPGLLHLLVRVRQPGVPGQSVAGAPPVPPADCYQLLLGVRRTLPTRLAPALIGRPARGPLAGWTVYDALGDPRLAELILERLRIPGRIGGLCFERADGVEIAPGLAARPLSAEQSNSSLVYGDSLILKVFRRVVPGVNPDLELPLALARTGCERVPAPVAWFHARAHSSQGDPYVLGVLQPYLAGADDGWELALDMLAKGADFTPEATALGRATAEVHAALAHALPTVTWGRAQRDLVASGMRERLDAAAQAVPALREYAPGLAAAFDALRDTGGDGFGHAQRVHGDLHLGQCLRAPTGQWSLIDFEGEPVRPLAERRLAQPPVRDVAGMLRSFDYAARSHQPWAPEWAAGCRAAYCTGYAEVSGRDPRAEAELLRAYETDKAVYEVLYEARHRPDWLPVPLAAVRRLATG